MMWMAPSLPLVGLHAILQVIKAHGQLAGLAKWLALWHQNNQKLRALRPWNSEVT